MVSIDGEASPVWLSPKSGPGFLTEMEAPRGARGSLCVSPLRLQPPASRTRRAPIDRIVCAAERGRRRLRIGDLAGHFPGPWRRTGSGHRSIVAERLFARAAELSPSRPDARPALRIDV